MSAQRVQGKAVFLNKLVVSDSQSKTKPSLWNASADVATSRSSVEHSEQGGSVCESANCVDSGLRISVTSDKRSGSVRDLFR